MDEKERWRCPKCGHLLAYRKRAEGGVCKNWKCPNYWKLGKEPVFNKKLTPITIKVGDQVPVDYYFELVQGEILKVEPTWAVVRYETPRGKKEKRRLSYTELIHARHWNESQKADPDSWYNRTRTKEEKNNAS